MSRTRIRYNHCTGAKYEIPDNYQDAPQSGGYFMPDVAEFVSPVSKSLITSRSQLREHNKRHQVQQCGELKHHEDFNNKADYKPLFHEEEKRFDRT